jgi:hypothetical protein
MKKVFIGLIIWLVFGAVSYAEDLSITITIPETKVEEIADAVAMEANRSEYIDHENKVVNPESKIEFMKRMALEYIKNLYQAHKSKESETVRQQKINEAKEYTSDLTVE